MTVQNNINEREGLTNPHISLWNTLLACLHHVLPKFIATLTLIRNIAPNLSQVLLLTQIESKIPFTFCSTCFKNNNEKNNHSLSLPSVFARIWNKNVFQQKVHLASPSKNVLWSPPKGMASFLVIRAIAAGIGNSKPMISCSVAHNIIDLE